MVTYTLAAPANVLTQRARVLGHSDQCYPQPIMLATCIINSFLIACIWSGDRLGRGEVPADALVVLPETEVCGFLRTAACTGRGFKSGARLREGVSGWGGGGLGTGLGAILQRDLRFKATNQWNC